MDMRRKVDFLERWKKYFGREEPPVIFWYTDDEGSADRAEPQKDHRCFLADLVKEGLPRDDENLDVLLKFSTGNLQENQRMADTLQEV